MCKPFCLARKLFCFGRKAFCFARKPICFARKAFCVARKAVRAGRECLTPCARRFLLCAQGRMACARTETTCAQGKKRWWRGCGALRAKSFGLRVRFGEWRAGEGGLRAEWDGGRAAGWGRCARACLRLSTAFQPERIGGPLSTLQQHSTRKIHRRETTIQPRKTFSSRLRRVLPEVNGVQIVRPALESL